MSAADSNGGSTSVAFDSYSAVGPLNGIVFAPKELDFGISDCIKQSGFEDNHNYQPGEHGRDVQRRDRWNTRGRQRHSARFQALVHWPAIRGRRCLRRARTARLRLASQRLRDLRTTGSFKANGASGPGRVLLTGYSQSASLSVSASEVDFGTQFQDGLALPRYVYISNASSIAQHHTAVGGPIATPFTVTDECPESLASGAVCRLRIDYHSNTAPSSDSSTLALDDGLSVLLTGQTMPGTIPGWKYAGFQLDRFARSRHVWRRCGCYGRLERDADGQCDQYRDHGHGAEHCCKWRLLRFDELRKFRWPPGPTCAVVIAFTPSEPGARQGLLTVSSGAGTAPLTVALSGRRNRVACGE